MTRSESIYDSPRLAAGYAYDRPPVHQHIIQRIKEHLGLTERLRRALDVGCGAGLSTAALDPLAETVVGLEPVLTMLKHRHAVAPRAHFLAGQAEQLPFAPRTFDLLAAAGALNYADRDRFLPEAERVLAPGGVLVIYDFSAGRRFRDGGLLGQWYGEFERRYPAPAGYYFDVNELAYGQWGLRLAGYEEFEVAVPMALDSYLPYALSETSVEAAIARGVAEAEVGGWCRGTLAGVFGEEPRDVVFEASAAYVRREGG